jgi:hypothetical protein
MNLCFAANDLLGWAQRIGCQSQLRRANPENGSAPDASCRSEDHTEQPSASSRSGLALDRDRHERHRSSPHRIPGTHRDHHALRSASPMKDPG